MDLIHADWDPNQIPFEASTISHTNTPLWFDAFMACPGFPQEEARCYFALACAMELDSCVFLWDPEEEEVRVISCDVFMSMTEILQFIE